jgi:dihydrodipicolinate synthase/N-acetylneuraminate lyase
VRTLESAVPPRGLSIPCVTILAPDGSLLEEDQRRLVRYLIQDGRGADVLFAMGTTGEWNRLDAATRHRTIQVVVEEVRKRDALANDPVEAWAGITAPTAAETLETLELALAVDAHAAVIAPLAIRDVDDPVRFLQRDVADFLDARGRRIPVYLYDNADIAAGREQRLRTAWVKQLSRLDFVRGIKVSASPRRLGHYTKAARHFRDLGPFGIYVGNAIYILDMMKPRTGLWGKLVERWNRFLLHDMLPAGVVSGPANLWPREWQRAWQVSCAGDAERMEQMKRLFENFRASYVFPEGKRSLATLKRGLLRMGVVSSDAVADGTPALDASQAERFDASLEELRQELQASLPEHWISDPAAAEKL